MKKLLTLLIALCVALAGMALAEDGSGEIVILHTNDIHCAIDDNMGFAAVAGLRDLLEAEGKTVLVMDAGDAVQGGPVGTLSTGSYIIDIMNEVGYDLAVPGNHEFDYGMERFFELVAMAEFPFVSCNFIDLTTGSSKLDSYVLYELGGKTIGVFGICTPKTITSSTPIYFQNDAGEYIYGFAQDADGTALYECVQATVNEMRAEGADVVIALAHLGIDASTTPWMSGEVIVNTTGIDVVIDGHSHSVIEGEIVKNKAGEDVLLTSTGTKLNYIGCVTINDDGITSKLVTEAPASEDVLNAIAAIKAQYEETLNTVVARTDVDLVVADPVTGVRIVRTAETNLGDLCADAYRAMSGAQVAFVNGGGVRALIPAGDITYGQILNVHPFGNEMCMVEATGAQILDALEMGVRAIPNESGGFLHVSGLTYEIHTYVESTVALDENGMFTGVTGEYRVKNVTVGGEPLELDKIYTLASHNYMLKNGGDGFNMFMGDTLLLEDVMIDNQVLINYITGTLGGVVGDEYADPYGQGRIIAVPEAPAA